MAGAGFIVGGWFATNIISKLINSLIDYAKEQHNLQLGLKEELQRVEKALPKMQAVVDAAESGLIKEGNSALQKWLWQLRDVADETEDMMDEIEYNSLKEEVLKKSSKLKVSRAASRLKNIVERALNQDLALKRLKLVVKRIDEVAADVDIFFTLLDLTKQHKKVSFTGIDRATSSLLNPDTPVFGRDKEKEEVIRILLENCSRSDDTCNYSILPIVGVGGVGKTTLAQFVYNDNRVKKHFDARLWVCVSDCFDVPLLTKKMFEYRTRRESSLDFEVLQEMLAEELTSKKFLIVMDDIWNDEDSRSWSRLFAPFGGAAKGSMVLITTRAETVARMPLGALDSIFLKGLVESEYWKLFKLCAFRGHNCADHRELLTTGQQIAEKLKGNPLAAKTVGGVLCSNLNLDYWIRVLSSDIWEIQQGKYDIIPALRLSYQHLDAHLKPCFRYCSIFPKDYEFDREKLVWMWIAVGLIQQPETETRRLEDIGDEYFTTLLRKSFFDCRTDAINSRVYYVMHDLLNDLAKVVSLGECVRLVTPHTPQKTSVTARHLSIVTDNPSILDSIKLQNLRTLILHVHGDVPYLEDLNRLLREMRGLRVLILNDQNHHYFPSGITELIHLRYLDVSETWIKEFPDFRRKQVGLRVVHSSKDKQFPDASLFHLQTLILNAKVRHVNAVGLRWHVESNLVSLRHLILGDDHLRLGRIPNMQNLTSLQELRAFPGRKIRELKNMWELRELRIYNLEEAESYNYNNEGMEINFKDKVHLKYLSLEWGTSRWSEFNRSKASEELLELLQPPMQLIRLNIFGYSGVSSPSWMTAKFMVNLVSIILKDCEQWEEPPPLEQLPRLKSLQMENMSSAKQLGVLPDWNEDMQQQWFPCLSKLHISNCRNLKRMPRVPLQLRLKSLHISNVRLSFLPELTAESLSSLHLSSCSKLLSLPDSFLQHPECFTALEDLTIARCSNLMELPIGGFGKLINLKKLKIRDCPQLVGSSSADDVGISLPSSLQSLTMVRLCGDLDASFFKSVDDATSLCKLKMEGCDYITSLPPAEVLKKFAALQILVIRDCRELASLGGLQTCASLKVLEIVGCNKLVASVEFPPENPSEDTAGTGTSSSTEENESTGNSLSLESLTIDDPSLFFTSQLNNAKSSALTISDCSQLISLPEEWLLQNCSTLRELRIYKAIVLRSLPAELQRLSSLGSLWLIDVDSLQSVPMVPRSLKALRIKACNPPLEERCRKEVGEDWPNIANVRFKNIIFENITPSSDSD